MFTILVSVSVLCCKGSKTVFVRLLDYKLSIVMEIQNISGEVSD